MRYHPHKCDCGCARPVWKFLDGKWQCLNGQIHQAVYVDRDDNKRDELYALIDAMKEQVRA